MSKSSIEKKEKPKKFISIRSKIIAAFLLFSLIILISLIFLSYSYTSRALTAVAKSQLEQLRETRGNQLLLWLDDLRNDIAALANNPFTISAMNDFNSFADSLSEENRINCLKELNQASSQDNPEENLITEIELYRIHDKYNPYFQQYQNINANEDLYLVTLAGEIIYSTSKSADIGTNLNDGPFSYIQSNAPTPYKLNSNISTVFKQTVRVADPGMSIFNDFEIYKASKTPCAFLGTGIFSNNKLIGVLIFRISINILNTVLNQYEGLGDTGESYVIGPDLMFRNDSRFLDTLGTSHTKLNDKILVDTRAASAGIVGISGTEIIRNYLGREVLSCWRPIVLQAPVPEVDNYGIIWIIIAEIQTVELLAPANKLFILSISSGLLLILIILIVSILFASRLTKPILKLTKTAKSIANGNLSKKAIIMSNDEIEVLSLAFNRMTSQLRDLINNQEEQIFALTKAEDENRKSIKEKEILLKEIHHRVKNNLSIISGLINLHSIKNKNKKYAAFSRELQTKVNSIALVHQQLYDRNDLSTIDFKQYTSALVAGISYTLCNRQNYIDIDIQADNIEMDLNKSISLGLIINELFTNAIKYAFPDIYNGRVLISLELIKDQYLFTFSDNGIGLPENFNINKSKTLGMQLIVSLTEQLSGKLTLNVSEGTTYIIKFIK